MSGDKTVESINKAKVYQDEQGDYFQKKVQRFAFITVDPYGQSVYSKTATETKTEKVRPSELGYVRSVKKSVFVRKRLSSGQNLSDEMIYFELPVECFVDETDPRSKHLWISVVRSGRVYFTNFEQAITYEANINDPTMCRRGKARRLEDNYLLPRNAPVYEQNASGELELFVEVNASYE